MSEKDKSDDLSGWSLEELRKMAVGYGSDKIKVKFWGREKLEEAIREGEVAKEAPPQQDPPPASPDSEDLVERANLLREIVDEGADASGPPPLDGPPSESDKKATDEEEPKKESLPKKLKKFVSKRFLVTWRGPLSRIDHNPMQEAPKIHFERNRPVDIETAILGMLSLDPEKDKKAKIYARKAAEWYKDQSKRRGTVWAYKSTRAGVTTKTVDEGKTEWDLYGEILQGEMDEVMKYVRELRAGKAEPVTLGPDPVEGEVEDHQEAIKLTIEKLYYFELDNPNYRPLLADWLFDESREVNGLPRLKTNIRPLPQEGE